MANDLIVPEILLIEKLEECDNSLAPVVWEQLKNDVIIFEEENNAKIPAVLQVKRKMFFSDFVNKAVSLPIEIVPTINDEAYKQVYRLYLFSCQQAIHEPGVRRNPFILGFHALEEVKLALVAILLSYRLVTPSAPYRWSREFFEQNIFVDKGADGHAIINIKGVPCQDLEKALNEDVVSDWLIYRGFDNNGIRTLMDIRNNLLTLPDYKRGGPKASEFSRFQRKMAEKRMARQERKEEALDLEFRKTLVQSVAEKAAEKLLASGMSTSEILAKAFSEDLSKLIFDEKSDEGTAEDKKKKNKMLNACQKRLANKQDTSEVDGVIAGYLESDE